MIVDTSALVAIALAEPHEKALREAMLSGGLVPAPAIVEFMRVMTKRGSRSAPVAEELLNNLLAAELTIEPFTAADAQIAVRANIEHGLGNGRGGTLNMIDLMVYAVAKRLNRPILCTGLDYAASGVAIHPASRRN